MSLPRRLHAALLAVLLLVLAGCGDEEVTGGPARAAAGEDGPAPFVSQSEARLLIERRVPVVWQGLTGASLATEVEPEPVDAVRLAAQNGREFVLLTFATPAAAERAWDSVLDTEVVREGGAATRAANVVAVFPDAPDRVGVYGRVWRQMRALALACRGEGDDAELGRVCFERAEDPEAPGGGADPEEVADIGATVRVDGFAYTPQTSRQLNPEIQPDEAFLPARLPPGDRVWFGVFLRVCNEGSAPARPSAELELVDAFGERVAPVDVPTDDEIAFTPERLEPGECLPTPGSVAAQVMDGVLVLFDPPVELLEDRPVALEVRGERERARVALDV